MPMYAFCQRRGGTTESSQAGSASLRVSPPIELRTLQVKNNPLWFVSLVSHVAVLSKPPERTFLPLL